MLLIRSRTSKLKPTETLWYPYALHCWWFEVYLMFLKFCLTGMPLVSRNFLPGLDIEKMLAETLNVVTVALIDAFNPYRYKTDEAMMGLIQVRHSRLIGKLEAD